MRDAEDTEYYEKHIPIFNQYNAKFKARLDTKDEPSGLDSSIEEDSIMNMLQNMDSTELNSLLEELQIAE
jgi:hypothetical protein